MAITMKRTRPLGPTNIGTITQVGTAVTNSAGSGTLTMPLYATPQPGDWICHIGCHQGGSIRGITAACTGLTLTSVVNSGDTEYSAMAMWVAQSPDSTARQMTQTVSSTTRQIGVTFVLRGGKGLIDDGRWGGVAAVTTQTFDGPFLSSDMKGLAIAGGSTYDPNSLTITGSGWTQIASVSVSGASLVVGLRIASPGSPPQWTLGQSGTKRGGKYLVAAIY